MLQVSFDFLLFRSIVLAIQTKGVYIVNETLDEGRFHLTVEGEAVSFSLQEAAAALGWQRKKPFTENELSILKGFIELMPVHAQQTYSTIIRYRKETAKDVCKTFLA